MISTRSFPDLHSQAFQWGSGGISLDQLDIKLRRYGMQDHQVGLLISRFVDGRTLKEIAKQEGWRSEDTVSYHIRNALKELKERGFK